MAKPAWAQYGYFLIENYNYLNPTWVPPLALWFWAV